MCGKRETFVEWTAESIRLVIQYRLMVCSTSFFPGVALILMTAGFILLGDGLSARTER